MKKVWHPLNWLIVSCAMITCGHAAPPPAIDPFLLLSSPTLASNQVEFTLTGEAEVSYVIESSFDAQSWLPVTTNVSPEIYRQIALDADTNDAEFYRAWRKPLPMLSGLLVTRSNISFSHTALIDSYDSADTNHSAPGGVYNPATRKAGGDVYCTGAFTSLGNVTLKGKLLTSQTGSHSIGTNGSVGDLSWAGPGIQPGWHYTNFHFAFPDVSPPYTTGLTPISTPSNLWHLIGGYNYYYGGNLAASPSQTIYVAGHATVYVTGTFNCKGKIIIAPGASLKLYVGGTNTILSEVLSDGHPMSFQYYGLPTNATLSWSGNDLYAGTIYAPQATVRFSGGGSSPYDFAGACVAESVAVLGHFNFHFDENLKRIGPMR